MPGSDPTTVVRRYFHGLFVERDLSVCDDLLAADYLDHDAPVGTPGGPGPTRDYVARMLDDYLDLQFGIELLVPAGPFVAIRAPLTG